VHGLRQRATPVNAYRPDPRHLRSDPRLCGVAHLEIFLVAATGGEAVATDYLVNVEEETPVELLGKPRTPECNRLDEQEADPPCLRISTRLTNRFAYDRPLQLLKAVHDCRIGKCPRREEGAVQAPISATRIRHNGKDRVAKRHISRTRCAQECIRINVLNSAANGLLQLDIRSKGCSKTALPRRNKATKADADESTTHFATSPSRTSHASSAC
jgi:hypothetical protein